MFYAKDVMSKKTMTVSNKYILAKDKNQMSLNDYLDEKMNELLSRRKKWPDTLMNLHKF